MIITKREKLEKDVLEYLSEHTESTAKEMAINIASSKSGYKDGIMVGAISNILRTMEGQGQVEKIKTGHYAYSWKLVEVQRWPLSSIGIATTSLIHWEDW